MNNPAFAPAFVSLLLIGCGASSSEQVQVAEAVPRQAGQADRVGLPSGRLPTHVVPTGYSLSLQIDPAASHFLGNVTIAVEVKEPTETIVLHGRELTILSTEFMMNGKTTTLTVTPRMAFGGRESTEELVLGLGQTIPKGKGELRVAYSAPLSERLSGVYRVRDNGIPYVFTQFEPTDARRAFPCFDEPDKKVPFELRISSPTGNLVVANSPEVARVPSEDGKSITYSFAKTEPLPTYLVAFAVGPFEIREDRESKVPLRLIAARGKTSLGTAALDVARKQLDILSGYFDYPYPYSKLDLLAVPEFPYGAMENAGLITFREELLLLDEKRAGAENFREMAITIAHELSHQWFGNLVTMKWWDEIWLNEGFATWMEAKAMDAYRPEFRVGVETFADVGRVMNEDARSSARAVRQPVRSSTEAEESFDGLTYVKGAAILRMLESWLGHESFRKGIRSYIKQFAMKNADSQDLFAALGVAANKDVWSVASTFLNQPGVPLVSVDPICKDGRVELRIAQEPYALRGWDGGKASLWKIPVCVAYSNEERVCDLLEDVSRIVPVKGGKCPNLIYPNADETGYYRSKLTSAHLQALASRSHISEEMKIGLLGNGWALVRAGELSPVALLEALEMLKSERSRLVIEQALEVLEGVDQVLVGEPSRKAFRNYVDALLSKLARDLGLQHRAKDTEDTRLLRARVWKALSILGSAEKLVPDARRLVDRYRKGEPVDYSLLGIALSVTSRTGSEKDLETLALRLGKAVDPEERKALIQGLGGFSSDGLVKRALDSILRGEVRAQDAFRLFAAVSRWEENRPAAFGWFRQNFAELQKKLPGGVLGRFAEALGASCDAKLSEEIVAFLRGAYRDVEGADRTVLQSIEALEICAVLRDRSHAEVAGFLGHYARDHR